MDNPWYIIIGVVSILAWVAIPITWIIVRKGRSGSDDSVVARLDAIDSRLAAVEKTLNDIP